MLFSYLINDVILYSQELDVVSADVGFGEAVEAVSVGGSVDYGVESEVHPVVTGCEVAYQCNVSTTFTRLNGVSEREYR